MKFWIILVLYLEGDFFLGRIFVDGSWWMKGGMGWNMDQKGGRAVTRDKRDNFLLFINSKNLRKRIGRRRVYTHMYIGAVFSCTGCSAEEGNAWTEGTRELGTGNSNRMGGSKSKTLEHSTLEHSKKAHDWMGTRKLDSGERWADAYTLKH